MNHLFRNLLRTSFLLILVLGIHSCKPKGCLDPKATNYEPEAKVFDGNCEYGILNTEFIMNFSMRANGEELAINEDFTDGNNHLLSISTFQFYISDIELLKNGSRERLSEAQLIDLDTNLSENPDAANFFPSIEFDAEPGVYSGFGFDIGVKADLNRIDPGIYELDEPLSTSPNMYWGWKSMYIFVKIEGEFDSDGDGQKDKPFFFHTGLDELFLELEDFNTSFEILENQKKTMEIGIDVEKVFTQLNLDQYFQTHTTVEDPNTGLLSADTASQRFTESLGSSFSY